MKTRVLLVALLSLAAAPALAGDRDPSPFYRNIFAVDISPVPRPHAAAVASDASPFYRNIFAADTNPAPEKHASGIGARPEQHIASSQAGAR